MTMPEEVTHSTVSQPGPAPLILRDDGKLIYDGMMFGRFDAGHLTVDLGWCREAGVKVTVKADPSVDRARSGIVLER